jgi:molecular chaperone GrpE (heat shock protein)
MSVTHLAEVLRQRNQFREELANVRCERDSQHALTTLLRNSNDRLESENVDLRTKITNLQAQIANTRKQTLQVRLHASHRARGTDGDPLATNSAFWFSRHRGR